MSVLFSRQCEYALQSVVYLALKSEGTMTSIKELSRNLDIPYHFLGKIMQDLTYKGLLISQKGPSGGFGLAMPAKDITFFHIVEAIDGLAFSTSCVLGFSECLRKNPCAVHERWSTLREGIYDMLITKNIAQLSHDMKRSEYRLAGG